MATNSTSIFAPVRSLGLAYFVDEKIKMQKHLVHTDTSTLSSVTPQSFLQENSKITEKIYVSKYLNPENLYMEVHS